MNKRDKSIKSTIKEAKELGIEAVLIENNENKVVFDYYVDDFSKLDEDYYMADENDEAVKFTAERGTYIARGTIWDTGDEDYNYSTRWQPEITHQNEEFFKVLTGIESQEEYVDAEYYEDYQIDDSPEVSAFSHADDLTVQFASKMYE